MCCVCISLVGESALSVSKEFDLNEILNMPLENARVILNDSHQLKEEALLKLIHSNEYTMENRWKALAFYIDKYPKNAAEQIKKLAKSNEWFMRNASLVMANKVDKKLSYELSTQLLKDKALVVRSAAVENIITFNDMQMRDLLWEELHQKYNFKNNQSLWIRKQIVDFLIQNPLKHEVTLFKKLKNDSDKEIAAMATSF